MYKLNINEDLDFFNNEFSDIAVSAIDLQWKLYRSALSRKSLKLEPYAIFKDQYEEFYNILDEYFTNKNEYTNYFSIVTRIDQLKASLEKVIETLKTSLDAEAYFELKISIEKITNYLKDLREKITNEEFA